LNIKTVALKTGRGETIVEIKKFAFFRKGADFASKCPREKLKNIKSAHFVLFRDNTEKAWLIGIFEF